MEIKYKQTYAPKGKNYSVGEVGWMLGYAMQLIDPRPQLESGKLEPGEVCMILLGITPEEYALRESDPKALASLAQQLGKYLPKDRMIGFRVVNLLGKSVQREVKLRVGDCMPDDDFAKHLDNARGAALRKGPLDDRLAECKRLQALCAQKDVPEQIRLDWLDTRRTLAEGLRAQPALYMAYEAGMNGRWPSFGFDGCVELFTSAERGERARDRLRQDSAGEDIWLIREIKQTELDATLNMLSDCGVKQLRVDNGFTAVRMQLDDLCAATPTDNATLRNFIQREVEYGMRFNRLKAANADEPKQRGALESMLTMRNFALRELGNAVLYVACPDVGNGRLCTQRAGARLEGANWQVVSAEKCMLITAQDKQKRFLAAFTSPIRLTSFTEQKGANVSAVAMTLDDVIQRAGKDSIMIDPGLIGYCVDDKMTAKALEIRDKPPMAVRIQPPKPQPQPQPQAQASEQKKIGLGDLPDPDSVDWSRSAPPKPQTDSEALPKADSVEAPKKKGFFKKLFGK